MIKNNQEKLKNPYVMILGCTQDGGYPLAICKKECCKNAILKNEKPTRVSCIAIVDPNSSEQWIIDATPDLKEQLNELYKQSKSEKINGIFLTHAHIGHYLGLAQLGKEVIGSKNTKVYCMKRMFDFLSNNGPWDQLIKLENIALQKIQNELTIKLNSIRLDTYNTNIKAIKFYKNLGYKILGEIYLKPNKNEYYCFEKLIK